MDPLLETAIKNTIPKMNPDISNGFVKRELDKALEYLNNVFASAFGSLGSNIKYIGYQRCRPDEEYRFSLKRNGGATASKARYELARSDVFLTKFNFTVDGKATKPLLLYVPYCDDTGLMHLRGTAHTISPVLEDPGISVTRDGCFFRVTCDKIVVKRTGHTVCRDIMDITQKRKRVQKHINVPWAKIYRAKQQKANSAKTAPVTSLPHYLFAKYGVTHTFKKYAGMDVVFGTELDITPQNYPDNEWTRFYSAKQTHPNNKRPSQEWVPTAAALAVRTTAPSQLVDILVAGYFYVADCYTHEFNPIHSDEPDHWRLMMGKMVFNKTVKYVQMTEYLAPHFASLDTYLDDIAKENLAEEGVLCEDVYELMTYIIANLDHMINTVNLASMYNKKLVVLPYVLSPIIHGIFYTKFNLMQQCKKRAVDTTTGEEIMVFTEDTLFDVLGRNLKPEAINKVKGPDHGMISSVAAPGDNKMFKINNKITLQQNATQSGGRRNESPMTDDSKGLDVSIADCASYLHITKPDPTGRSLFNPFKLLVRDKLLPSVKYEKLFSVTQAIIYRRNI
ncbi:putative nvRNAP beta subunit 1 [Erwinia phage vB_EamM_RAY]|uniref:NvRNAP beta subunit 1 n=4 Tax=Agricanvirus TaxID=1984776 RepID=A0A173GDY9_9CAUD|nr:polymerase [Erwinia phage vB_EamM_Deimos-Minion]YP_009605469.1 polymerase [Erwinia phage vB_EamM_RAY]YP_009606108.1 polymerase [Erwinia phage vB_EamM_Special G]YP_009621743.1 polymerase [Erwinia phage vB_EamM_Desertfox]ANH51783.1 putative nvRNAP beta subunit 1 [Erwinia phage vB_EamM_RAY]ANH52100.1 putative RNA polymerase beta subunit [Erwinia phage vB_EamM_Deimos-Minion]ANJ64812.1 putative RNA polymerase beta subunit [Erwinia phage vB_EamM_Special G]AUG86110.1 putative RNA polymerase beta